jgi:hypothetical protein
MMKILRDNLFRIVLSVFGFCLIAVLVFSFSEQGTVAGPQGESGRMEKMIVASGTVTMNLDLNKLSGSKARGTTEITLNAEPDSFFKVMAFNDEFRGSLPSSMRILPGEKTELPGSLVGAELNLESAPFGGDYELVIRDGRTGMAIFNVEGHQYEYVASNRSLELTGGRVILSKEYAASLGRPSDGGAILGDIRMTATMRPIEVTLVDNGDVVSEVLPALGNPETGTVPGPDVVVGDVIGLAQFGSSAGTQVGLAVGTDSCNYGTVDLNWFALPSNDHPVIPQNLYRMSGGSTNTLRFEQIGQSSVKHAFTALTQNLCQLGCNGVGGSRLGSGCSDPYSASLNAGPSLGSRAWINPFTGAYPRGDSATPPNSHGGHAHVGPSHRILTEIADLSTSQNPGATYYAEAQYVTPHEYAWCQSNPTQCNMYNNVSYRRYNVNGTGSPFTFSAAGSTVRTKPALDAWTGATQVSINPAPGVDGIGTVVYKVTETSPGVWHYEYAIYNQNIDRAIRSFSVPLGAGGTLSNVGFHAPPQHPGWTNDGTTGSAGFSSVPWTQTQTAGSMTWSTETFAVNPNANAIRWGTMYNFRFDSNRPPQTATATIGFLKTGEPITVQIQAPSGPLAGVSVSGRVATSSGMGIRGATVTLTGPNGTVLATTSGFGYYRFDNVIPGATYTIAVLTKKYSFDPVVVQVNDHVAGVNFTPTQEQ